jgi:protein gp37
LGVSAEDQQRANERIPILLTTPAAIRFVSVEPQLERVLLAPEWIGTEPVQLDWVICGGESGHGARPFDVAWARSLRNQCQAGGVAFFGKQDADARGRKLPLLIDGAQVQEFPR